jgi:hypothetical protein
MQFWKATAVSGCLALILGMCLALDGWAQTADYHLSAGMRVGERQSPTVEDMAWARDPLFVPAPGRRFQVFILAGPAVEFSLADSRDLPVALRAGNPAVLMFDGGRWQPLRPLGLRFGPEIGLGLALSRALPGETVGLVLPARDGQEDVWTRITRAVAAAPCRVAALIDLGPDGDGTSPRADDGGKDAGGVLRARLGSPGLRVLDFGDEIRRWRAESVLAGDALCELPMNFVEQAVPPGCCRALELGNRLARRVTAGIKASAKEGQ